MAKKPTKPKQTRARTPRKLTDAAETQIAGIQAGEVVPELTPEVAAIFAKLLSIGCPTVKAMAYFAPGLSKETLTAVSKVWAQDTLVQEALNTLWGGAWIDLPAPKRYELALDKMLAEAAFFVWTTSWVDAGTKEDLDKLKESRNMLMNALGKQPDKGDPMQLFAAFGLELARNLESLKKQVKKLPKAQGIAQEHDLIDDIQGSVMITGRPS